MPSSVGPKETKLETVHTHSRCGDVSGQAWEPGTATICTMAGEDSEHF